MALPTLPCMTDYMPINWTCSRAWSRMSSWSCTPSTLVTTRPLIAHLNGSNRLKMILSSLKTN